jgi:hypothetical protein
MTPQQLLEQMEQHRALIAQWNYLLPGRSIDPFQFSVWLRLHPFARIVAAIEKTGRKSAKLAGVMSTDHLIRFCSKAANNLKTQQSLQAAA